MNSDFHYFGTGTAALAAGMGIDDAKMVANAAEFVDFFDSNYWSYWTIVAGPEYMSKNLFKFSYPQLSTQIIGIKMAVDYNHNIWNAFHFPPGNRPLDDSAKYPASMSALVGRAKIQHQVRETSGEVSRKGLLCRPYSQFVLDMVADTIEKYKLIKTGDNWKEVIASAIRPQERYISDKVSRDALALMFLGMRMHILADTWAHQDFTGSDEADINGAGFINNVYADCEPGSNELEKVVFTNTLSPLNDDNDCAAAPAVDGAYKGHGQMGHYPDYGWLTLKYPAAWEKEGDQHRRENPKEFQQAWTEMAHVIALCTGKSADVNMPDNVRQAITKKFKLDPDKLSAVNESEKNWANDAGKDLATGRWGGSAPSKELGIKAGITGQLLPLTREGEVWIIDGSKLHLFELASVIHYQWCVGWSKRNEGYGWTATELVPQ